MAKRKKEDEELEEGVEEVNQDPTVFFFSDFLAYYCTDVKKKGKLVTGYVLNGRWPMIYNRETKKVYFNYNGEGQTPENIAAFNVDIIFEQIVDQEQLNTWRNSSLNVYGLSEDINETLNWAWFMKDNQFKG